MEPELQRRWFLQTALAGAAGLCAPAISYRLLAAEPEPEQTATDYVTPETQAAIDRGLAYLLERQNEDGSFGVGGYSRNVAVSGLAGMAFMSSGSMPLRGPHGVAVSRCIDYIIACANDSGFISEPNTATHGPMYGHGFATLFLAECYGMTQRPDARATLSKAVELIVRTQNSEGGWRYFPVRRDADISVTICQVMALRAARNAGLYVPNETIDRCVTYVKRCQNADGGFAYLLSGGTSMFPRSAAGVVALMSAGVYEGPEIEKGLAYLERHAPRGGALGALQGDSHYFYGQYYAVQAMWHAGGRHWAAWYPAIRDELLARQNKETGAWIDFICAEYGTAMATLVLQMPNNYLPIFQR